MHARSCLALLAVASLAASSPVPEPEPAPIDPKLAAVLGNNLNLACQHDCAAASSSQELNANAALGSSVSPLSVVGGLVVASSILAIM